MEIDEEKVNEAVLALLYLTTFKDKPNLEGMEKSQLGFPWSTPSEGLHLRSRHESKICSADRGRCEAVARSV
jgi:hypothetical protein